MGEMADMFSTASFDDSVYLQRINREADRCGGTKAPSPRVVALIIE